MRLNIPNHTNLMEFAKSIIRSTTGVYFPFHEHDLLTALVEESTLMTLEAHTNIAKIIQLINLNNTNGALLDRYGLSLGLARSAASKSILSGRFKANVAVTADIFIPANTTIYLPATATSSVKRFITSTSTIILTGNTESSIITALAETTGESYNGVTGNLSLQTVISQCDYFEVTSTSVGGSNRENDSDYKEALRSFIQEYAHSTTAAIESFANRYNYDGINITAAKLFHNSFGALGEEHILIVNDGAGMTGMENTGNTFSYTATGGELYVQIDYYPIYSSTAFDVLLNLATLTLGTDYVINYAHGVIELATPLTAGDIISIGAGAPYTFWGGIIYQLAMDIREEYTPAGMYVLVRPPTDINVVNVIGTLTLSDEALRTTIIDSVETSITEYISNIDIGEYVSRNKIIDLMMNNPNVTDCTLTTPSANVSPYSSTGVCTLGTLSIS